MAWLELLVLKSVKKCLDICSHRILYYLINYPLFYNSFLEGGEEMMRTTLTVLLLLAVILGIGAYVSAAPPEVICVPYANPNQPGVFVAHDTWSGLEVTLKGTAHDPDGDATLATYEWDFGDGSPPETGSVTDPYAIEARHVYTGGIGDLFVARLTVTDTSSETASDDYLIKIGDGTDIKIQVNVAIDEGLWRLHKDQMRGILPDGAPYGSWPYGGGGMIWTRGSGTPGDIIGSWSMTEGGVSFELTFNPDGSVSVVAYGLDCGSGPATYTSSGTYNYYPSTGYLTINITASDFACDGPTVGIEERYGVSSVTSTELTLHVNQTVAVTAACTEAFEIQGSLPDGDPSEDPYVETVQRGLNSLFSLMVSLPVAQDPVYCPLGDPDVNNNDRGILCYTDYHHSMYEQGIALMALASSGCPGCTAATGIPEIVGETYLNIAQDMVDYLAFSQNDPVTGNARGGWRYHGNYGESDNSVSQWPVIGMEAAEVNFGLAGLLVPQFVKDELNLWIDYIQDDLSGGSGYIYPDEWVNIAKTGGLLCEMKFVGDTYDSIRAQNAIEFINSNWDGDPEHFLQNSYYAYYSVMKGFRLLGIETIAPIINDPTGFDWYHDPSRGYAPYIVGDQQPDGAWFWGKYSVHPLTSAWALLTLQKTVVNPGPVADAGPDVPCHAPIIDICFDGTGSYHNAAPAREIVEYSWDFGDGSPSEEGPAACHAFPAVYNPDGTIDWESTARDYEVCLTVTDDGEPPLTDEDCLTVHICPPPWPPVACANVPQSACACNDILLDASCSYDPNGELYPDPSHPWYGEIVSWEWDLDNDGDYDDAIGETINWSNCEVGLHIVGLRVCNNYGECDEIDIIINVEDCAGGTAFLDIKPGSCPNPLNVKNKGILPVAVLGTEEFDVTRIDPSTILLTRGGSGTGVAPIRWSYEDVATPFEDTLCDCHDLNGDGYLDLTLKFKTQEVVTTLGLGDLCGETIPLTVTGNLEDGTAIAAQDCVWLLKEICDNEIDDDYDGLVDSADADCLFGGCGTYPVADSAVTYFFPYLLIPVGMFVLSGILLRKK
jgi:hypothetical protein